MIYQILNEELGISNDVISLKSKIKNLISNDYATNKDNNKFYGMLPITPKKRLLTYHNTLTIPFNDIDINVRYYVIDEAKDARYIDLYHSKYSSSFELSENKLHLFLSKKRNKINWMEYNETLQHEIEHWYQQYKKGNSLLSDNHIKKYNKYKVLRNGKTQTERNIGMIYYYDERIEHDAIMNGLYSKIMSMNEIANAIDPIDILKSYRHYTNIKAIQSIIEIINNNIYVKKEYADVLDSINKNISSFIKTANNVVNEYIKGFGRTIYKAKRDLEEKYKNTIY